MNELTTLSNGRVLERREKSLIAWPSHGAAERGDPSEAIHQVTFTNGYPLISRDEASTLTGISINAIRYAAVNGRIKEVEFGERAKMLDVDDLIHYASGYPHNTGRRYRRRPIPPHRSPCSNCRRAAAYNKGMCATCYQYGLEHGEMRPVTEPAEKAHPDDIPEGELCTNCKREAATVAGLCAACYQYQRRNDKPRPPALWRRLP